MAKLRKDFEKATIPLCFFTADLVHDPQRNGSRYDFRFPFLLKENRGDVSLISISYYSTFASSACLVDKGRKMKIEEDK